MAQTQTYSSLVDRVGALLGASFGTTEKARIKALANRRAEQAYRESHLWENYLVIGEERAVDDTVSTVPYTGAAYDNTASNPYAGLVDSFFRVFDGAPWLTNGRTEYAFSGDGTGARLTNYRAAYGLSVVPATAVLDGDTNVLTLTFTGNIDFFVGGTFKLADFDLITGIGGGVDDINGTQTVATVAYAGGVTTVTASHTAVESGETTWLTAAIGTCTRPSVWCVYKKRHTAVYGDLSTETAAIPQEWFEFMAAGVYADMLRADDRHDAALVEDRKADDLLKRQLERLDTQGAGQQVFSKVRTHGTETAVPVTGAYFYG